jgi:hypothetical protein
MLDLREQGINSINQLDELIRKSVDDRQELQDKIKNVEAQMSSLSEDMENIHTINQYREIYRYNKNNPNDKQFAEEYYSELSVYQNKKKSESRKQITFDLSQKALATHYLKPKIQ